jgi:hypothetical protein
LSTEEEEQKPKQFVICDTCGEYLEYILYYAQGHLEKYPDHKSYSIKWK